MFPNTNSALNEVATDFQNFARVVQFRKTGHTSRCNEKAYA